MNRLFLSALFLLMTILPLWADLPVVSLKDLKVEYETTPLGIDVDHPRFSWRMEARTEKRGYRQMSYRIVVNDDRGVLMWNSGRVHDDVSIGIPYAGKPLKPASRYRWRLEVWNQKGDATVASSWFETGLMPAAYGDKAWEGARWIGGGDEDQVLYAPYLPVFRLDCRFRLDEARQATTVGFFYGANDPRLMDANRNLYGLASGKDESYIKVVLDTAPLDSAGEARINVYRAGYAPTDRPSQLLQTVAIPRHLWHAANRYEAHTLHLSSNLGFTQLTFDDADAPLAEFNLNPLGQGGDFIAFPVLGDVGLYLPAGQGVTEADICVRNYRSPANPLTTVRFATLQAGDMALSRLVTPHGGASPMLRTRFMAEEKTVLAARLYVTARGIYDVYLNGYRIGDDYFNPGVTEYNKTHLYQTFDVTPYISKGDGNVLGAVLAEGWWSGAATFVGENWNFFGDRQSLLAKLVITYDDGSRQVVVTDPETWRYYGDGPWRYGSLFQGEVYDARRELAVNGWSTASYDDTAWKPAREVSLDGHVSLVGTPDMPPVNDYSDYKLVGQTGPTVKLVERLTARSVQEVRPGVYVYDMGQNMAGVPCLRFRNLSPGTVVRLRFAEVTYPDLPEYAGQVGMLMLENIRAAMAQDIYIAKGIGQETFSPRFTYHGYRYVEVTGIDRPLPLEDVQGLVLSSIHQWTAHYETSNTEVNRLWENITWSARANFFTIPTDCPQRNERLGWAGDISVFSRTATYLANVPNFLNRYLQAMRDVQRADGRFADIAPLGGGFGGVLWGSAGITVPWECYRAYGDKNLLAAQYEAMQRYILYIANQAIDPVTNLIVQNQAWGDLGDWLGPEDGRNDKSLLWEAYFVYDLELMQKVATVLGHKEDAYWYGQLAKARKDFFLKTYVQPITCKTIYSAFESGKQGQLVDTQTSYVLPLALNVVDSIYRERVAGNLAATLKRTNIADNDVRCPPYSLMTGFIGTAWIGQALSENGYSDLAYRLLQQTSYPSWLYSVEQGATTIWERLNSYTHTDGFGGNNRMNSFNHYSFGAIGAWMCGYSLGIRPDESAPGYKRFILQPEIDPTGQMRYARGYYDSMYGRIESGWQVDDKVVRYTVTVPANTTARLILPAASAMHVRESGRLILRTVKGVKLRSRKKGCIQLDLQPGRYDFEVKPWW